MSEWLKVEGELKFESIDHKGLKKWFKEVSKSLPVDSEGTPISVSLTTVGRDNGIAKMVILGCMRDRNNKYHVVLGAWVLSLTSNLYKSYTADINGYLTTYTTEEYKSTINININENNG